MMLIFQKMKIGDLRVLMTKAFRNRLEELCEGNMMESAFADVGLSLNIDGSEDHKMKFQGQPKGKTRRNFVFNVTF